MPAAAVWLANIANPNTRRAYKADVEAFMAFCGIERAEEFREVTRAHVIAWRRVLESSGAPVPDWTPRPLGPGDHPAQALGRQLPVRLSLQQERR